MLNYIIVGMLIDLCERRKVKASYFAEKYKISTRTVYRYVEILECAGVMLETERGEKGGIALKSEFSFFSMMLNDKEKNDLRGLLNKNIVDSGNEISKKLNLF